MIITTEGVGVEAIGIDKIAVDIVMIEDMEGVVVDDLQRSLMNPPSLHLLVGCLMVLYKEI